MKPVLSPLCKTIAIPTIALLLSACDTRRDVYADESISVSVTIDWKSAGIWPNGATLWFFPHTEGRTPKVLRTNGTKDKLTLPRDTYSVLVFNEAESDHDYIRFRGTDRYETFEAYVEPDTETDIEKLTQSTNVLGNPLYYMPDPLAVAHLDELDLKRTAVPDASKAVELLFAPDRLVTVGTLQLHLKGMDNIRLRNSYATLSGLSPSIKLANGEVSSTAVAHFFHFNSYEFNSGSYTDGIITGSFALFAPCTDTSVPCTITLHLGLRDGTRYPDVKRDVTDMLRSSTALNRSIPMLRIELGTGSSNKDPVITLPTVPDNEESGSGFDAVVDAWGDEIETVIPIK